MVQKTAYIVDDEESMIEVLSEMLEELGYRVHGFNRAEQFFARAVQPSPGSILLLDLNMPGMDGIQVMRRLTDLKDPPDLILISGFDESILSAAEKLGRVHKLRILGSLKKPIHPNKLRKMLACAERSQQQQSRNKVSGNGEIPVEELESALKRNEFILHYQPQLRMHDKKLVGLEALVRWQHPQRGLLFPDAFIPLAERYGVIERLTQNVIASVVNQGHQWDASGILPRVSVNVSPKDIVGLTLPEQLSDLLAENSLSPENLTVEVTETAVLAELVTSLDILTRIRLMGINLSIDDFGTGYSSLQLLHQLPFNEIKIDRSFVANMKCDREALNIVKSCINLGHDLNLCVVVEGIEDQDTWNLLVDLGCDIAQGYFISKPVPPNQLAGFLRG